MLFSEIETGWTFTVDSEPGIVYEKTGTLTGFRVGQPLAKIGFFTPVRHDDLVHRRVVRLQLRHLLRPVIDHDDGPETMPWTDTSRQ
jgi:hypothetical protein